MERTIVFDGDTIVVHIRNKHGNFTARLDRDAAERLPLDRLHITGNCLTTPYLGVKVGGRTVKVHGLLCEAQAGHDVDHINFDSLDNRRSNLRSLPSGINRGRRRNSRRAA
ncbi:HNH endonuclease [Anaeromyxobacter dehalogenans]|uniref:HNH endonuclease n=1 Tax=Anaeromyxobacter dehalogenans TaxID=161493 RepID=UPI0002FF0CEB|nr:HNH endonuclease [Anaeromyxobacter dehalogenans]